MNKKIFYNQVDSRWAKHPYTHTSKPNATIKSSGCGPTSLAMLVSSLTNEIITPNKMGDILKINGYRAATGTSMDACKFIGNTYNLEYKKVDSDDLLLNYLANGYVAIVSVIGGSIFSTSGHIIFLCGYNNGQVQVHDPYLYNNKFNSYGRSGKVKVSGNDIWITSENWKKYAKSNIKYVFKIPENKSTNNKYNVGQKLHVEFDIKVACDQGGEKIMVDSNGYQFWCAKGLLNQEHTKVLCLANVEDYNPITNCYQMVEFKDTIYETRFDCKPEYLTDKY